MEYLLTGAAGNIAKPLAKRLMKAGHQITIISRNKDHCMEMADEGAHIAIGSVYDRSFLKEAFKGADAVYTMYPPDMATADLRGLYENTANNYVEAIAFNHIKFVVNLSSVGAHLSQGSGHIYALYLAEQAMSCLTDVHIRHIRPVYFYTNLFSQVELIRNMGMMGGNFTLPANDFPLVHPDDIAAVIANELLNLDFRGHSVRYVASEETGTDEIAAAIGKAIGNTGLKWVKLTDKQTLDGLIKSGIHTETAKLLVEGFRQLGGDRIWEDYRRNRPSDMGLVKLDDFARQFAAVYHEQAIEYLT